MIVLLKLGIPSDPVVDAHGEYADWFRLWLDEWGIESRVVDATAGDLPDSPAAGEGLILMGSRLSITDNLPWMDGATSFTDKAIENGADVFGVCFGHQVLAQMHGGVVEKNPNGWEIGTVDVEIAEDDGLIGSAGETLTVQATHQDAVVGAPPGAIVLAANEIDGHQAFRYDDRVHSVQFHPEATAGLIRFLIDLRGDALRSGGLDPCRLSESVTDTPAGPAILRRFIDRVQSR